jgi:hypothetical protein
VLARQIVESRGAISDGDLRRARDAGLGDAEIGEVVGHVAINVFTNYFNQLADTEIDFPKVEPATVGAPQLSDSGGRSTRRQRSGRASRSFAVVQYLDRYPSSGPERASENTATSTAHPVHGPRGDGERGAGHDRRPVRRRVGVGLDLLSGPVTDDRYSELWNAVVVVGMIAGAATGIALALLESWMAILTIPIHFVGCTIAACVLAIAVGYQGLWPYGWPGGLWWLVVLGVFSAGRRWS